MQYTLVGAEDGTSNITVFVKGSAPLVAHSTHVNFDKIVAAVVADDESVVELFDVAQTAATKFQRLSDRITTANGRLYLDNVEVANALTAQVIRFLDEGVEDWKSLVLFFENVLANPNEHSREQLYTWLESRNFSITNDGLIIGYKGVRKGEDGGYVSVNQGTAIVDGEVKTGAIPNAIGSVVEMPRNEVTHDPSEGCSTGLHVGTYDYARGWAQGALLEVHVNPRDVVSVPTDCGQAKMRVCRYTVVDLIEQEYTAAVVTREDDEDQVEDYYVGKVYADRDPRRKGRTLTVVSVDRDEQVAYCQSSTTGNVVKVKLGRLISKDYEEVDPDFDPEDVTVNIGDIFQDLDPRRVGRTVTILESGPNKSYCKSLPSNVHVWISTERLTTPHRFRKV